MSINTISGFINSNLRSFASPMLFEPDRLSRNYAVGIELELEGVCRTPDLNANLWTLEGDGSLRGNGMEIKCAKALSGSKLERAIDDLDECLANQTFNLSERCSTHIHIDVSDMTVNQLYHMLLLSTMFEHVLFRLFGNTRLANTFCMPVDTGTTNFQNFSKLGGNLTLDTLMDIRWSKYAGISLNRIRDLGTVEYRMFCPVITSEAYYRVIEFLFALKTEAMQLGNPSEIVLYKTEHSLSELFSRLFPNEAYSDDFEDMLERGVQTMNDIITVGELKKFTEKRSAHICTTLNELNNELDTIQRGI